MNAEDSWNVEGWVDSVSVCEWVYENAGEWVCVIGAVWACEDVCVWVSENVYELEFETAALWETDIEGSGSVFSERRMEVNGERNAFL